MGYNQFGGREINQAKLDLLKKHTTAGNIIVADTSALLYRANPSGEEHLSFSKKIAVQTNEARFYRALRKCIEDKEIDLFITTEVMEELDQISKLGKEINRKVTGLSPAIDGLIDILTEKERIFSPEYIEYPFYTEALRLRDDTLLTFIREIVYNNPKVRTRKISRTDAGIAIALLYASQSEEISRVLGIFRDEDVRYLERTFLLTYPKKAHSFIARHNGRFIHETRLKNLAFVESLEGEPGLRRMPIKRIMLPGEKPQDTSGFNARFEKRYGQVMPRVEGGVESQIIYRETQHFPSSTSNA